MKEPIHILVVEDEKGTRFFLEQLLMLDGYLVTAVASGEAALLLIQSQEFNVAILDLDLGPGISGLEVLDALRQQTMTTQVIIFTGHATLETAIYALRQDVHDYLSKPSQTHEIRDTIWRALHKQKQKQAQQKLLTQLEHNLTQSLAHIRVAIQSEQQPSTEQNSSARFLQKGPISVDLHRRMITLNDQSLHLSPTEFAILVYLVHVSPRVLSAKDILLYLEGDKASQVNAEGMIRTHIYRIRQKMKKIVGHTDIIKTVRGVGYLITHT